MKLPAIIERAVERFNEKNDVRVRRAADKLARTYGLPTLKEFEEVLEAALALHKVAEWVLIVDSPRGDAPLKSKARAALINAQKLGLVELCKKHLPKAPIKEVIHYKEGMEPEELKRKLKK